MHAEITLGLLDRVKGTLGGGDGTSVLGLNGLAFLLRFGGLGRGQCKCNCKS